MTYSIYTTIEGAEECFESTEDYDVAETLFDEQTKAVDGLTVEYTVHLYDMVYGNIILEEVN